MPKVPSFRRFRSSSQKASRAARGSRSTGTKPELLLRQRLWALGARYRIHAANLPGTPDIVFTSARVAVFCDGDFWHGRDWAKRKAKLAKGSNQEYWIAKIGANRRRDSRTSRALKRLGWVSFRVWEGDIRIDSWQVALEILRVVDRQLEKHETR